MSLISPHGVSDDSPFFLHIYRTMLIRPTCLQCLPVDSNESPAVMTSSLCPKYNTGHAVIDQKTVLIPVTLYSLALPVHVQTYAPHFDWLMHFLTTYDVHVPYLCLGNAPPDHLSCWETMMKRPGLLTTGCTRQSLQAKAIKLPARKKPILSIDGQFNCVCLFYLWAHYYYLIRCTTGERRSICRWWR